MASDTSEKINQLKEEIKSNLFSIGSHHMDVVTRTEELVEELAKAAYKEGWDECWEWFSKGAS